MLAKERTCNDLRNRATVAKESYVNHAERVKQEADKRLADEQAHLIGVQTEYAEEKSRIRDIAAKVFDGSINAQIKNLGDYLRSSTLALLFGMGVFVMLVLISGVAVWLKLGCRGGLYDKLVLMDEAQHESDHVAEHQFLVQRNQQRLQSEMELLQQIDPVARQQRYASEIVTVSLRRHVQRMTDVEETLKGLPSHLVRNWRAVVEAGFAADQAVTVRWLEDYYQSTGRPFPADWLRNFDTASSPTPLAPERTEESDFLEPLEEFPAVGGLFAEGKGNI